MTRTRRPSAHHPERELSITSGQRFQTGMIATLVRGDEVRTIHEPGGGGQALRAIARVCDEGGWKIRSLCAPNTIFRDLQGDRQVYQGGGDFGAAAEAPPYMLFPENSLLGHIGRLDLLAKREGKR